MFLFFISWVISMKVVSWHIVLIVLLSKLYFITLFLSPSLPKPTNSWKLSSLEVYDNLHWFTAVSVLSCEKGWQSPVSNQNFANIFACSLDRTFTCKYRSSSQRLSWSWHCNRTAASHARIFPCPRKVNRAFGAHNPRLFVEHKINPKSYPNVWSCRWHSAP